MFGKGKCCSWLTEHAVVGAGAGGLTTRCCSFLSAQRKMGRRKRGEGGGREPVVESQLERANTHLSDSEEERTRRMVGQGRQDEGRTSRIRQ